MEQEKQYLKVGDILYPNDRYGIGNPIIIDRVTKTQAISGNKKFKIEYNGVYAILIGPYGGYRSPTYYLETPELKQQLWRSNSIYSISKINFNKLSDQQLNLILKIINN